MKNLFKYGASVLAAVAMTASFTACNDWTETEPVDVVYDTADQTNPAAYQKYLENIRAYRATDHKLVYAWIDNAIPEFTNQSHRLTTLPDSIDVLVFTDPISIDDRLEIEQVRTDKGMKVMYVINYDDMNVAYLDHKNAATEAEPYELTLTEFVLDSCSTALTYANANNFDGIIAAFDGKVTITMSDAELKAYKETALSFLGLVNDWKARNPGKKLDYYGKPENVANFNILDKCDVMFLSESFAVKGYQGYTLAYNRAVTDGIDASKFGMATTHISADPTDLKTGYSNDGSYLVLTLGDWAGTHNVKAVGFQNVQNDYFATGRVYDNVRRAIQLVNPAKK